MSLEKDNIAIQFMCKKTKDIYKKNINARSIHIFQ